MLVLREIRIEDALWQRQDEVPTVGKGESHLYSMLALLLHKNKKQNKNLNRW